MKADDVGRVGRRAMGIAEMEAKVLDGAQAVAAETQAVGRRPGAGFSQIKGLSAVIGAARVYGCV